MAEKKASWDDVPSLDNLKVDWEFEPENPLGKRRNIRILAKDLNSLLASGTIPIKILVGKKEFRGTISDLSESGAAVMLESPVQVQQKIAIGFFLGKEKIVSRAIVQNCTPTRESCRVGVDFVGLPEQSLKAIQAIIASKNFKG